MPSATWQNLPYHFKQNAIELLDFESRCALQTCSKQDDYIVRRAPLTIQSFQIDLEHADSNTFKISVQFEKKSARKHKKQNLEATCATFVKMFSRKNMFTKKFQIELNFISLFFDSDKPRELWSKLLESEFQINCEQFIVVGRSSEALLKHDFVVWRFLQRVNTKYLESIVIETRISENELVKIMESKQFKTSDEIYITMQYNDEGIDRIKRMLSSNNIMGIVEELKANEARQFIQNFYYSPRCHLELKVNKEMDITSILRRFGVLFTDPDISARIKPQCTLTFQRWENWVNVCFSVPSSYVRMTGMEHILGRRMKRLL